MAKIAHLQQASVEPRLPLVAKRLGIAPQLALWAQRRRTRRALAQLDERALRDVGLTRAEAMAEARKPFWRA
ncbi:MAG: DUF1127 domain-containing protein [Neomegalonema sp.]|nr:DUF1127 domain-containing protein [Neomegalonema sp.]